MFRQQVIAKGNEKNNTLVHHIFSPNIPTTCQSTDYTVLYTQICTPRQLYISFCYSNNNVGDHECINCIYINCINCIYTCIGAYIHGHCKGWPLWLTLTVSFFFGTLSLEQDVQSFDNPLTLDCKNSIDNSDRWKYSYYGGCYQVVNTTCAYSF